MGKRSNSTSTATGDADGSTSAKPATDGDAGNEHHAVSDSKSRYVDEENGYPAIPSDPVEALAKDINNFDSDRQVFETLRMVLDAKDEVMKRWFNELRAKWNESAPMTPKEASRLVFVVLQKIYSGFIESQHLEGMLLRYGLPDWREEQKPSDWDGRIRYPEPLRLPNLDYYVKELLQKEKEDYKKEMKKKQKELEDFKEEMKKKQKEMEDIDKKLKKKQKEKEDAEKEMEKYQKPMCLWLPSLKNVLQEQMEDAEKEMKKKQKELEDIDKEMKKKQKQIEDAEKELKNTLVSALWT